LLTRNSSSKIVLVAALGNPGNKYLKTRHNAGFIFADRIAESFKFPPFLYCLKIDGHISVAEISGMTVVLLKPSTYMNRSGLAVSKAMKAFNTGNSDLIVVHDDTDIDFGRQKIKNGGGDGGHRGIRSIAGEIQTPDFTRIRIGIGSSPDKFPLERYVLSDFLDAELNLINNSISSKWGEILLKMISDGVEEAMNTYNRRNG
jgi:peptidyl-tRNA hydrolase, PTH1 family